MAGGISALVIGLWLELGLLFSLGDGVMMFLAIFLSWAIAREVDPDHAGSANLAAVLTFFVACFNLPGLQVLLGEMFVLMLMLRILIRSTGPKATVLDLLLTLALGLFVGVWSASWVLLALLAATFLLDFVLPDGNELSIWPGAAALMTWALVWVFMPSSTKAGQDWSLVILILMVLVCVIFCLWVYVSPVKLKFRTDLLGSELSLPRLRMGRLLFVLFALMMSLYLGPQGAVGLAALWAVVIIVPGKFLAEFLYELLENET